MTQNSPCGIIQDLLPLYKDNVCGEESRRLVEEHLRGCPDCARMLKQLNDSRVEQSLSTEAAAVLENHRRSERRTAVTAGLITAGALMVPVIVCLICNLAVGHALDWFFLVLTSLLAVASVTVVPMLANEYKFSKAVGCFAGSVVLLLLACCLYTGGDWFAVAAVPVVFGMSVVFGPVVINQIPLPKVLQNRKILTALLWDTLWLLLLLLACCLYTGGDWFFTAAVSVIFGLSVVFGPVVIHQIPLPKPFSAHKGAVVMLWDTLWLFGILISSAKYGGEYYWHNALFSATWCLLLPWFIFVTARYFRLHPLAKAGIIVLATGVFTATLNDVLFLFLLPKVGSYGGSFLRGNLADWANSQVISNNVFLLILLVSVITGVGLLAAGIALGRKRKKVR